MVVSPLTITVALEYARTTEPGVNIPSNIWNSPASKEVKAWLEVHELVEQGQATPRLHAWIEMICETPLPIQQWVRPPKDAER